MPIQKPKKLINPGEIINLGPHRLLFGDAHDRKDITKLIKNNKIRTILTDPPYSVNYVNSKIGFTQKLVKPKEIINDQIQSDKEYIDFTKKWLKNIIPFMEKKNSIYIFNSDKMIFALREAIVNTGLHFSQLLIWIKNHAIIGRLDYLPQHELIAYAWFGTHLFKKSKDKNILFYPKPNKSKLHPTMKPVPLLRKLILNSSNINDIIYDPFAGSGSLMVACEQTHRRAFMIEIDKEYCQTIIERYNRISRDK